MSEQRYVWHKSCEEKGEGQKWELDESYRVNREYSLDWSVHSLDRTKHHFLPRSEYVPCPAPERWGEVVVEAREEDGVWNLYEIGAVEEFGWVRLEDVDYRLKSITIERKVQP